MRIFLLAALLLSGCKAQSPHAVAPPENARDRNALISLEAAYRATPRGPAIHFTLRSVSTQSFSLYPYQLPWGNPNSINLWAYTQSHMPLQTIWPIADPGPETPLTVAPGDVLQGDFLLQSRIGGLAEALSRADVTVTWQYSIPEEHPGTSGPLTGGVVVPQQQATRGAA
jgi:hypothetical protein